MVIFQILDSFAQDLEVIKETETTREIAFVEGDDYDSDGEIITRRRKRATGPATVKKEQRMVIHLFAALADGTSIRVNLEGFRPFFFVRVGPDTDFEEILKEDFPFVEVEFVKRKTLFGYSASAEYDFAKLSVPSLAAFRTLKNAFLDKESRPCFRIPGSPEPLEVFEANLDPMLRFFHLRNLQTCGWASIDNEMDDGSTEIDATWEDIVRCTTPPVSVAPFLLASWDIECYSDNGEFPIAKRGYERIAKLLCSLAHDAEHAKYMLLQAALYPENPPSGMDAIRHRTGHQHSKELLESIMNTKNFDDLGDALEAKDSERVLKILKALERHIPLAGDPVIQIGVVLQRGQAAPEKHVFVLKSCEPVEGATLHNYKTERELILGWATAMRDWNTDILVGYNVFGFDERYVWQRAEELGIHKNAAIQALTRLENKEVRLEEKFLSSSALGDNTMYIWSAHGRLQIDLYHYVKRSYPLASYKLDDVCQNFMSGKLSEVVCTEEAWTLKTKSTSDVIPGRYVVLLDETGDAVVEKLCVTEVRNGELVVAAPSGDDVSDLAIAAATAVKWAIVKDDVSPQEIFKLHRGSAADRSRVAAYCIQDCVLVLDLYKKLDVFNNAMAMANACSVPIGYIFTRGQGIKIESLIFKECYERGQCILTLPAPPQRIEGATPQAEESYEGAIVLDPVPGFYFDSPVGVADFASLYPSTIISENISYDTLCWVKNYSLSGKFVGYEFGSEADEAAAPPEVRWTDIEFDIWGFDPEDKRKHPAKIKTGIRVCRYAQFPGDKKGALPDIVQKLLATRKAKRKEAEKETDPFKKALLDAEQLAYKLTANSLYGQLGSPTFKIRLQHLAASVTAYGRKQILFAKAAIERFYGPEAGDPRCAAAMVYGDTDSLFVNFNVKNPETGEPLKGREAIVATIELTEEAGKFVSRALKPPHDFEYDKVFHPFIIFSKKRYVGNKYEESPDSYYQNSMGIATKRRDYAGLVKVIYGGALRILLTEKDIGGAIRFVREKLTDLVEGKMSLNLLTMSKSLRAEYASSTPPAHKVLAERIKARDPGNAPASGDRIAFIYVMPPPGQQAAKLQGDRVETPAWIKAKGLKPDYKFYIEHQLMNPLTQLFALVAEQMPGVTVPSGGWKPGDREIAATKSLFSEVFARCDRMAMRSFGAMFGMSATPGPVTRTSQRLAEMRVTQKALVQPKMTYFIDKMIVKNIAESKKAAKNKKAKQDGTG
jgi:DNA polymerase elongation subunit (family B)